MNAWLASAVVVVVLVTAAGVGGIFLLTKSIGTIAADAVKSEWHRDEITRLLRKVALLGSIVLLLNLLPWSVVITTVGGMADQYFRNLVNRWMSGAELFQHLAIDEEEYYSQPLHWRQALAEISLREGDEEEALKQFVSRLGTYEIGILELAAKYALSGGLVDSRSAAGGDPMRELSRMDLMHLEAIGIIDSVLPLNHKYLRPAADAKSGDGSTDNLWLVGHQYAIHLRATTAGSGATLSFMVLTEVGSKLFRALRRPTSLRYLCWHQHDFRERQISAEIWSITWLGVEGDEFHPVSTITDACDSMGFAAQELGSGAE